MSLAVSTLVIYVMSYVLVGLPYFTLLSSIFISFSTSFVFFFCAMISQCTSIFCTLSSSFLFFFSFFFLLLLFSLLFHILIPCLFLSIFPSLRRPKDSVWEDCLSFLPYSHSSFTAERLIRKRFVSWYSVEDKKW